MKKNATLIFILVLVLELASFRLDTLIPHGFGEWILYFFPLLLLLNATPFQIIGMVICVTILELLGGMFSPPGNVPWYTTVLNRISGLVVLWIISLVYLSHIRSQRKLRESEEQFRLTTLEDLAQRKRVEEELLREKIHLNEAQRVAHIGSWIWDLKTDVAIGSDELLRIYGINPAKERLPNFKEQKGRCFPGEDWERVNEAAQKTIQTGVGFELDVKAFRDGVSIWVTSRGEPVRDAEGRIVGLRGTVQDITGRKALEESLRKSQARLKILNENLETMVVQRTQQVRDLSKELTIAEQHERQRFSMVLHEDLQQILFGAKMLLDTIDCTVVEKAQENESDIREIKLSIQKAIVTTKSLAVELNPPILKNEGLDAALRWLARQMQERYGLVISIDIANSLSVVRGVDQILIVQLARELLYNIVKHAQTSEVVISGGRDDDTASISIEDKGVGFDVKIIQNRPHGFEGLGLFSIIERLKLFGGRLDIQSQAGKGTRITICIPLTTPEKAL